MYRAFSSLRPKSVASIAPRAGHRFAIEPGVNSLPERQAGRLPDLARVLVLVDPLARGVPDVDPGTLHRLAVEVDDGAADEDRITDRGGADDRGAVALRRRSLAPERAHQVRRRLELIVRAVVLQADQRRHAE